MRLAHCKVKAFESEIATYFMKFNHYVQLYLWKPKLNTMNPTIKNIAIKYGSIFGALNVLYILYAYIIDKTIFTMAGPGILIFFIGIGIYVFAISKVKQSQGGYATFKDVFSTYIISGVVATAIGSGFNILLFGVVDPEFASEIMELIIDTTLDKLEGSGMSDDQITEIIDKVQGSEPFGILGQLKSAAFSIMFNAVVGLIVAAAMKKNNPDEFV